MELIDQVIEKSKYKDEFAICIKCETQIKFKTVTHYGHIKELKLFNKNNSCLMCKHIFVIGRPPWIRCDMCNKILCAYVKHGEKKICQICNMKMG